MSIVKTVIGTVVGGELKLDETLDLKDESRVRVTIQPLANAKTDGRPDAALDDLLKFMEEHPIDSGGIRFTREELYERD